METTRTPLPKATLNIFVQFDIIYVCLFYFTSSGITKKTSFDVLNKEYTEGALRTFTKYIIAQDISLDNNLLTYIDAKPFVSYDFAPTLG